MVTRVFSSLLIPVQSVDCLNKADSFAFSFLYEVTDQKKYLDVVKNGSSYPVILIVKLFTKNNSSSGTAYSILGHTIDLWWIAFTREQWDEVCTSKGFVSRSRLAWYKKLYTNKSLFVLINSIMNNKQMPAKVVNKFNRCLCISYTDITLCLCAIRQTVSENAPWICWYTYVAYMAADIKLDESKLSLHTLMCTLPYTVNDTPVLIDDTMGNKNVPSPINWIKCLINLNQYHPFITTLPNRMVSKCERVINGAVRLYEEFDETARQMQRDSEWNEERKLAKEHSNFENSVINVSEVSTKKMYNVKMLNIRLFYDIVRYYFHNLPINVKVPFAETEDVLEELKRNFVVKTKELFSKYSIVSLKNSTLQQPYSEIYGAKSKFRHLYRPYSERGFKSKVKQQHRYVANGVIHKKDILRSIRNVSPVEYGLVGRSNWIPSTKWVSCFMERRTFNITPTADNDDDNKVGDEFLTSFVKKHLPFIEPGAVPMKRFEHESYYSMIQATSMEQFNYAFRNDRKLNELINHHLDSPSKETFLAYCVRCIEISKLNEYNFHQIVCPNTPVYAFCLDLDFEDRNMAANFHSCGDDMFDVQAELMRFFKELILLYFKQYHDIHDMDTTSHFAFYVSIPDDTRKEAIISKGIRGRIIWRSSKYMLKDAESAMNISNNLNRMFVDVLLTEKDVVFDSNSYTKAAAGGYGTLRLPLCMKENANHAKRIMVPIIMDGTVTYIPQFGMIHEKGRLFDEENGVVLTIPPVQYQYKERRLTESSMIIRKFIKNYKVKITDSIDEEVCRAMILKNLNGIKSFIMDHVLSDKESIQTSINPSTVVRLRESTYMLTRTARACCSKIHRNWSSNPVSYFVNIRRKDDYETTMESSSASDGGEFTCTIRTFCFGCGSKKLGDTEI